VKDLFQSDVARDVTTQFRSRTRFRAIDAGLRF
jgi:hypothetical protein